MKKIICLLLTLGLLLGIPSLTTIVWGTDETNDTKAISYFEIKNQLNSDFQQYITVYCELDSGDAILTAELYDSNAELLEKASSQTYGGAGTVPFFGIDNQAASYFVKFWLEDDFGIRISPIYEASYEGKKLPFSYGVITGSVIDSNGWGEESISLKIADPTGKETSYRCESWADVNGEYFESIQDMQAAIPLGSFVRFTMLNDAIGILSTATTFQAYSNVTYNTSTKTFQGLTDDAVSLPIYYSYNNRFLEPYLDENHKYNILVYKDHAIHITDMTAKDYAHTIKSLSASCSIFPDFSQAIDVFCETTNTSSVLCAQLYDEDDNLVSEKELQGSSICFDQLPNTSSSYTIKLWLKNASNNPVSPVYEKISHTEQFSVLEGEIISCYADADDFNNKLLYLMIQDTEGNTETYFCDASTWFNGSKFALDMTVLQNRIPFNTPVQFAEKDGFISILNFDNYQQSIEYCIFADQTLDVGIYAANYMEKQMDGIVYLALYDRYHAVKSITRHTVTWNDLNSLTVENISYTDGDYVKTFLWGNATSPLTEPCSSSIT